MKHLISSIISSIFIILPLPLIILCIYEFNNSNYIVKVDNNNINTIQNYLEKDDITIDGNVKEIILHSKIFSYELNIIYDTNENKKIYYERPDLDNHFVNYLIENNINNKMQIIGLLLIPSIFISINQITKLNKKEIIYWEIK